MGKLRRVVRYLLSSPLVRQTGIYGLSHMASKAIPFLLLPILTRYLSPADYGVVSMFMLATALVMPFIELGLNAGVNVVYVDDSTDLGTYITTGWTMVLASTLVLGVVVTLLREPITRITAVPTEWVILVVPLGAFRTISATVMVLWRIQSKALLYGLLQNLQSAAIIGGALVLIVVLGRSWEGRIEAELLASGLCALFAIYYLRRIKLLSRTFKGEYARQLIKFGVPLIPAALSLVLVAQTDRLFVTNLVSVEETGLLTVGFQIALLVELASVSFNNAYLPWLFERLKLEDPDTNRKIVRFTYVYFVGIVLLAIAAGLWLPHLVTWVLDESYVGSARYVRWFAAAFAFMGMRRVLTNFLVYSKRTGWLSLVIFGSAILNIPLNVLFMHYNGAIGAAQATAAAAAIAFVGMWWAANRSHPMPWLARPLSP